MRPGAKRPGAKRPGAKRHNRLRMFQQRLAEQHFVEQRDFEQQQPAWLKRSFSFGNVFAFYKIGYDFIQKYNFIYV